MKLLQILSIVLLLAIPTTATVALANDVQLFQVEQQAQQHCPSDTVVWVNTKTGVYHFQGQRWYANTKQGAFVCQQETKGSAMRSTRNGQ